MSEKEKDEYEKAVGAPQDRLETGSKVIAAQDFRRLMQEDKQQVMDFICKLEQTFWLAYAHDNLLPETRDTMLLAQMQVGLRYSLVESPAVSCATSYPILCVLLSKVRRGGKEPSQGGASMTIDAGHPFMSQGSCQQVYLREVR